MVKDKTNGSSKADARIKVLIEDEFQNKALEEVLLVYEDKRLVKALPHTSDRVEVVKTIFNRSRDLEREKKRVTLTREDADMAQWDIANKLWKACPHCGAVDINFTDNNGKEYQACFNCRHWLNDDGTTRRMKP